MFQLLPYVLMAAMLWLNYVSRKYSNNAKLIMLFGKKGCGKTTDICKKSMKYRKKGRTVYTTEYIPNTYHIEPEDVGPYEFEPYSVILIDEVGMVWDARDFKTFSKEVRDWFKLQRHRHITVYLYSQCFDIDKKLRDLCDELWIIKSYFNVFSVKKRIKKDLTIVEAKGDQESRITDDLKVLPFFLPGARQITYTPKYHKYFDSFAAPPLEMKEFEFIPPKTFPSIKELLLSWIKSKLKLKRWQHEPDEQPVGIVYVSDTLHFTMFRSCSIDIEYSLTEHGSDLYGLIRVKV